MPSQAEQREQAQRERAEQQQKIADKMKAKQVVVPPPAPQAVYQQEDAATCRKVLEDAGWALSGIDDKGNPMFSDPLGENTRKNHTVEARELPNRDGSEPTIVKQVVVPLVSWSYKLGNAYHIQSLRNKAKQRQVA